MEKKVYHYEKEFMEDFYLGGITCPNCSDIQNPKGQSKFIMVKIDDYKVKCNKCGTYFIFDK